MLKANPLALASITLLYASGASAMLQPSSSVVILVAAGGASSFFTLILPASGVIAEQSEALWVTRAVYIPATVAIYS